MSRELAVFLFLSFGLPALALLPGCATREPLVRIETVEVMVPVPVKAAAPPALLAPLAIERPEFIPPADPAASSALSRVGEIRLKRLLLLLHDRDRAWRIWAGGS